MSCRLLGAKLSLRNLNQNTTVFTHGNACENVVCNTATILFRTQCVKTVLEVDGRNANLMASTRPDDASRNLWSHRMCLSKNISVWVLIRGRWRYKGFTMTSSNGNIFRVTGHLCGNSPVTGEFPAQRPVTPSFDVLFDLRLNKRLSKQLWGWWFETPSHPLWRQSNM